MVILDLTFDDLSRSCTFKLRESKPRMSYCVIDTLVYIPDLPGHNKNASWGFQGQSYRTLHQPHLVAAGKQWRHPETLHVISRTGLHYMMINKNINRIYYIPLIFNSFPCTFVFAEYPYIYVYIIIL